MKETKHFFIYDEKNNRSIHNQLEEISKEVKYKPADRAYNHHHCLIHHR